MSSPRAGRYRSADVLSTALADLGRPWWPFPLDLVRGLLLLEAGRLGARASDLCDEALLIMFAAFEQAVRSSTGGLWEWVFGDWLQRLNIEIARREALGWKGQS